ncbi:PE family protein, partial [Mycobacterium tuberculosis]
GGHGSALFGHGGINGDGGTGGMGGQGGAGGNGWAAEGITVGIGE